MVELLSHAGHLKRPSEEQLILARKINTLNEQFERLSPQAILERALEHELFKSICVVSSFGAESAVLLHMVSKIRPDLPVLMIDTGKLFAETLHYRTRLQHQLGLEDVRSIAPKSVDVEQHDPVGTLSGSNPDLCCDIRKTRVLQRAISGFGSWINGRKRYQSDTRSMMSIIERDGPRLKLSPLGNWKPEDIKAYSEQHELPTHPLVSQGYASIGCRPCTDRVRPGEDPRSGRWKGLDKTECGIHSD